MADVVDLHSTIGVKVLFKRQDDQHTVNGLFHLLHATAPPGPYLRADQVKDGNSDGFEPGCQSQIEVWKIYQDRQAGKSPSGLVHEQSESRIQVPQVRQSFKGTQHSQIMDVDNRFDTALAHSLSAATKELERLRGDLPQQVCDELRCVHVSGSLSGDNENRLWLETHEPLTSTICVPSSGNPAGRM